MRQINIRNIDSATAARLKRNAKRRGQSLNRYLQSLLRKGAEDEVAGSRGPHSDLDSLAGTWSAADLKQFEQDTAPFSEVDKALWR